MRIALVSTSSRRVGGVEEYVSLIAAALYRAGVDIALWHEVDIPADRDAIELPPGTKTICASDAGLDASLQQLREWKPDVLYVQSVGTADAEAKLLDVAPAVFFLHTYTGTCISGSKTLRRPSAGPCSRQFGPACLLHYFPNGCGGTNPATMLQLFNLQQRRLKLFRRYGAILTHSDHMRDEMTKHGVHADVIPYPVAPACCAGRDGPANAWRLLYAGRAEVLKGGHYLIRAIGDVARAVTKPIELTIAGDGRERGAWEALAKRVQRKTPNLSIEFVGWVSQTQVGDLLRHCDLLVVPSLWPEPFGAIGPFAAQYGVPTAAFDSGGIRQWLGDGVTGHLAPANPPTPASLAQAITRCLEDPVHYSALRSGATQMSARFTMERHLPALMQRLNGCARS